MTKTTAWKTSKLTEYKKHKDYKHTSMTVAKATPVEKPKKKRLNSNKKTTLAGLIKRVSPKKKK